MKERTRSQETRTEICGLKELVCRLSWRVYKIDNGKSFSVFQYRKESLSLPIIKPLKKHKAD